MSPGGPCAIFFATTCQCQATYQPSKPKSRTGELAGGNPPRKCGLRRAQTRAIFVEFSHLLGLILVLTEATRWLRLFRNELGRARSALAANPLGV